MTHLVSASHRRDDTYFYTNIINLRLKPRQKWKFVHKMLNFFSLRNTSNFKYFLTRVKQHSTTLNSTDCSLLTTKNFRYVYFSFTRLACAEWLTIHFVNSPKRLLRCFRLPWIGCLTSWTLPRQSMPPRSKLTSCCFHLSRAHVRCLMTELAMPCD